MPYLLAFCQYLEITAQIIVYIPRTDNLYRCTLATQRRNNGLVRRASAPDAVHEPTRDRRGDLAELGFR